MNLAGGSPQQTASDQCESSHQYNYDFSGEPVPVQAFAELNYLLKARTPYRRFSHDTRSNFTSTVFVVPCTNSGHMMMKQSVS